MPDLDPETLKCKPCNQSAIAKLPAKWTKVEDRNAPQTSAQAPPASSWKNLTLTDWLTVYAFVNEHPTARQGDVVRHFATLKSGTLIFDQSTLSCKLRERPKMEARINDNSSVKQPKR